MRAVVLTEAGPALVSVEQSEPHPGEVLVRVHSNAVNRADLDLAAGRPHGRRGVGSLLGWEAAGEVVGLGDGVTNTRIGDRVMVVGGAFADFLTVAASQVLHIPDAILSYEEAVCFPVACVVMHNAIVTVGGLQAGETVLVQGASSTLGLLGMQIAKKMGAGKVIGSSTRQRRREQLATFGADGAVDTTDSGWVQAVLDATDGKGVDLIIDLIGGDLITPTMRAARILGRIINVGRLGGDVAQFDADLHAFRRISYTGVTSRTRTPSEMAAVREAMVADLWASLSAREFSLPVDSVYALEDFGAALGRMKANEHFGKIVLRH